MNTRKNPVSLYLVKMLFILVIAINNISCDSGKSSTVKEFGKETEVFSWYLDQLGHSIDKEKHYYYLFSSITCSGCKVNFDSHYSKPENATDSITLIMTKSRYDDCDKELVLKTLIDTFNLMDKLNWDYGGMIYIETENEKIKHIHNLTSEDILELIGL